MENENIRENENLTPEEMENENSSAAEEVSAEITEENGDVTKEELSDVAEESGEETENPEDLIGDEWQEEAEAFEEVQLSEEELEAIRAAKKKRTVKILVASGVVALVVAIFAAFYCYTEGVGSKTAVDTPMQVNELYLTGRDDNIKFQSPVVSLFKTIFGKEKDAVMTINGKAVDEDILSYITNQAGLNCVAELMQTGMITSVEDFGWDAPEFSTGLSYLEYAKGLGLNSLVQVYSLAAEGEKHGIVLSEEDEQKIKDNIEGLKTQYGENFELALKQNGFPDEETLFDVQVLDVLAEKTSNDVQADVSKYATTDEIIKNETEEKVTVKHILIAFDNEMTGEITDEMRSDAKKKIDEVAEKIKNGEDFDKLIEEYNQDPGATDEGYTFANDGTMVQSFADASFALKVGEVSDIVETSYGYHIIKRIDRAVSVEDYLKYLFRTSKVKIKKSKYDDVNVTINLEDYFGTPIE
ncbi:MAG: peptidylprolyl isomerase [Clostridia bacterium]|nr:peptidylprolyl isomerase [Clostridia bacterium]